MATGLIHYTIMHITDNTDDCMQAIRCHPELESNADSVSLVPRPRPAFRRLQYGKATIATRKHPIVQSQVAVLAQFRSALPPEDIGEHDRELL